MHVGWGPRFSLAGQEVPDTNAAERSDYRARVEEVVPGGGKAAI